MILDFEDTSVGLDWRADIVIVGAGAVGLSMFADLTASGHDVMLLEAGGRSISTRSQSIFQSATNTGHLVEGLHIGRYRYLGGTTNFWGGQLVEFDPIVFQERNWIGSAGWPIEKDDLKPYYLRAMKLLGMGGGIDNDQEVWKRAGVVPPEPGEDLRYFFTRWIRTPNFSRLFASQIASASTRVLLNANVVGLGRVPGSLHEIVIKTFDGKVGKVRAKAVVLACGTIETSRLLLLPYHNGGDPPWKDNTWLGRSYLDHIDFEVGDVALDNVSRFGDLFENMFFDGVKYTPKLKLSEEVQIAKELVGVAGSFIYSTSYKEHSDNVKLFLRSLLSGQIPKNITKLPGHFLALWKVALPMAYRYLRSSRMFHPKGSRVFLRATSEQVPLAESSITLNDEVDALGVPTVNLNWAIDGRELDSVACFAECVASMLERNGLGRLEIDELLIARDPAFLAKGDDTNHQMGGCRMGSDAASGVVDADCRLFGAEDIYVGGAAVMPSSGFPNCTLTSIALGLRLADHLRGQSWSA